MSLNEIIYKFKNIVGSSYVIHATEDLIAYEYDGSIDRSLPNIVVIPKNTKQISEILKICYTNQVPVIARGAGTGLSGGAIAQNGGVSIGFSRMTEIIEIDPENHLAIVEPGVINSELSEKVSEYNLYYAPDPSSQQVCTLGGNIAENSGGLHCLKYGVTTNHIIGMEIALSNGDLVWVGDKTRESPGYDLRGIVIGSEGTLALATKLVVRLLKKPETVKTFLAAFKSISDASEVVSQIISSGIIPSAIEMMDKLAISAVESSINPGYPHNAEAILLVEIDGLHEAVIEESKDITQIFKQYDLLELREAQDEKERINLWKGRKGVLGALGHLAPNYYLVDGTIPRTKLVEVLGKINQISKKIKLPIANVLHAGDGNLHPAILFNERNTSERDKALEAGAEILKICVEVGGVLSGEHGIGLEKQEYMPLMFNQSDLKSMSNLIYAFDSPNFNPNKIFPTGKKNITEINQSGIISQSGSEIFI